MALDKFRDPADPAWEQRINGLENGGQIEAGAITTAKLANNAVTEAKLAAESVSEAVLKNQSISPNKLGAPFTAEAPAGENELKLGAGYPSRSIVSTYQGNGAETKVKVKHSLGTAAVHVQVYGESAKAIGEPLLNAAGAGNFTYKTLSTAEIEVIFGTAVAAKALAFIKVTN